MVVGKIRSEVFLELDPSTGKWRTIQRWVLPDSAPTDPATLTAIQGLNSIPTTDWQMVTVLAQPSPLKLTFRLDNAPRLPEEVERLIIRKPAHDYFVINVDVGENGLLGLALETLLNKVVVVSIREGSVGEERFKKWDSIVVIDRIRVSEAQVAKLLIRDRAGKFEAVVERGPPAVVAATEKAFASKMENVSDVWWASFDGPEDVEEIVANAIAQRRTLIPAPSIFFGSPRPQTGRKIVVNEKVVETRIVSDIEHTKPLRKVPKL